MVYPWLIDNRYNGLVGNNNKALHNKTRSWNAINNISRYSNAQQKSKGADDSEIMQNLKCFNCMIEEKIIKDHLNLVDVNESFTTFDPYKMLQLP